MSKRDLINRMTREGQSIIKEQERQAYRKEDKARREAHENELLKCFMCQKDIPRKHLTHVPGLGHACSRHTGVKS